LKKSKKVANLSLIFFNLSTPKIIGAGWDAKRSKRLDFLRIHHGTQSPIFLTCTPAVSSTSQTG